MKVVPSDGLISSVIALRNSKGDRGGPFDPMEIGTLWWWSASEIAMCGSEGDRCKSFDPMEGILRSW